LETLFKRNPRAGSAERYETREIDMDLKVYYQRLRQTEASLTEPSVVLVSLATPDGGRAGVVTEAPREIAAKMIVDGVARLGTAAEAADYREKCQQAAQAAEKSAMANRIQVTLLSEPDFKKLSAGSKGTRRQ
jgi:hypothetical protein